MLEPVDTATKEMIQGGKVGVYWASAVEYVRELSGDRNHVAHVPLVLHAKEPYEFRLGPSLIDYYAGLGIDAPRREALDVPKLNELVKDFEAAYAVILDFCEAVQLCGPLPHKYFEPVARRRPPRKQRLEAARRVPKGPPGSSPP